MLYIQYNTKEQVDYAAEKFYEDPGEELFWLDQNSQRVNVTPETLKEELQKVLYGDFIAENVFIGSDKYDRNNVYLCDREDTWGSDKIGLVASTKGTKGPNDLYEVFGLTLPLPEPKEERERKRYFNDYYLITEDDIIAFIKPMKAIFFDAEEAKPLTVSIFTTHSAISEHLNEIVFPWTERYVKNLFRAYEGKNKEMFYVKLNEIYYTRYLPYIEHEEYFGLLVYDEKGNRTGIIYLDDNEWKYCPVARNFTETVRGMPNALPVASVKDIVLENFPVREELICFAALDILNEMTLATLCKNFLEWYEYPEHFIGYAIEVAAKYNILMRTERNMWIEEGRKCYPSMIMYMMKYGNDVDNLEKAILWRNEELDVLDEKTSITSNNIQKIFDTIRE